MALLRSASVGSAALGGRDCPPQPISLEPQWRCFAARRSASPPSAGHLKDMMETARFYPEGDNELEHTGFTQIPSQKVKPPSIAECKQILECTVDEIVDLDASQGHIVGNIVALMVDEDIVEMGREDRLNALDLAIGLGDERRKDYFYGHIGRIEKLELEDMEGEEDEKVALNTGMPWDEDALKALRRVPGGVRRTVIRETEARAKEKGVDRVTVALYGELARDAGMDESVVAALLATDKDRSEVSQEIAVAQQMGVTGVPCFIIDNKYAVMGAQGPEHIAGAIKQAAQMKEVGAPGTENA